jgi:hypothetical protein
VGNSAGHYGECEYFGNTVNLRLGICEHPDSEGLYVPESMSFVFIIEERRFVLWKLRLDLIWFWQHK